MEKPLVSIACVTFNHEKYIRKCIESILSTQYPSLEVIVMDDGSTDATMKVLEAYKSDSRIKVFQQKNQGPSVALSNAIAKCRGEFIATFSGDDAFLPNKIDGSLEYLNLFNLDIVFGLPQLISNEDEPLDDNVMPVFFNKKATNSREVLLEMFFNGNFLNASTSLARRKVYDENPHPFDKGLLQLQDFATWIHFAKKYKLGLMQERTTEYRVNLSQTNLSGTKNDARTSFELHLVYETFFDGLDLEEIKEIFKASPTLKDFDWSKSRDELVAELCLIHGARPVSLVALKMLYKMRMNGNFDTHRFFKLSLEKDPFGTISQKNYERVFQALVSHDIHL